MTNLISSKEAKLAWANGEELEFYSPDLDVWFGLNDEPFLSDVFDTRPIRLKPRTITINGVDVPACGVDYKPHTPMFVLNSLETCEYSRIMLDESAEIPHYWWSTEDEIKQVVAALCQVFGEV